MLTREALEIVGGLSKTSKMPCPSYGLPTAICPTGGKLRCVENSVCSKCYVNHGRGRMKNVQDAQWRRNDAMDDPRWVEAMTTIITNKKLKFFRWFDSGDLKGRIYLEKIFCVVSNTSFCKHWIPTKESKLILDYLADGGKIPGNCVIRVSSPMIDMRPLRAHTNTSTVHWKNPAKGHVCSAQQTGGRCETCRACWDKNIYNISYPLH